MARPKKEETLTKLTIRIPNKTIKTLQSESKKSGTTLSDTIRKKLGWRYSSNAGEQLDNITPYTKQEPS
jgi:hypothetical protein